MWLFGFCHPFSLTHIHRTSTRLPAEGFTRLDQTCSEEIKTGGKQWKWCRKPLSAPCKTDHSRFYHHFHRFADVFRELWTQACDQDTQLAHRMWSDPQAVPTSYYFTSEVELVESPPTAVGRDRCSSPGWERLRCSYCSLLLFSL